MIPTIGRIVHYTNLGDKDGKYPPEVQAALVTGVYFQPDGMQGFRGVEPTDAANQVNQIPSSMFVDLTVFYRTGYFQCKKIPFAEEPTRGHWNWPPKQ